LYDETSIPIELTFWCLFTLLKQQKQQRSGNGKDDHQHPRDYRTTLTCAFFGRHAFENHPQARVLLVFHKSRNVCCTGESFRKTGTLGVTGGPPPPPCFDPPAIKANPPSDSTVDPIKYQNWIYHRGVEPRVLSQDPLSISHTIAEIPHLRRVPSFGHK